MTNTSVSTGVPVNSKRTFGIRVVAQRNTKILFAMLSVVSARTCPAGGKKRGKGSNSLENFVLNFYFIVPKKTLQNTTFTICPLHAHVPHILQVTQPREQSLLLSHTSLDHQDVRVSLQGH